MLKKSIDFEKYKRAFIKNTLPLHANEMKADIIDRTQNGLDVNNNAFKKYSKAYAKEKAETFGSTTVNLTRTEAMLNAIDSKPINKGTTFGLRFFFNSKEQNDKAYANQVTYNRKFFGFNKKEKDKIKERIIKSFKASIK